MIGFFCQGAENGWWPCPPEDCGGPFSFPEFVEAVCSPYYEDPQMMLDWVGYAYDPGVFDREVVNRRLRKMR